MPRSSPTIDVLATAFAQRYAPLGQHVSSWLHELAQRLEEFFHENLTPVTFCQLEQSLQNTVRRLGQRILEWVMNQLEDEEPPAQVRLGEEWYRLRPKSPRRCLDSLFGPVRLWRYRYEASTPGEASRFPLEERLGIEAQRATPALAERAAWWSVAHTQAQVVALLRRDCAVLWSIQTLRRVVRSMSTGMVEHREKAQVAKLKHWLQQAAGPRRPILSVGRDGVMVPLRHEVEYREAAAGTVSVLDGGGRRLGTVYLGRMPEESQRTLSRQMTGLITQVIAVMAGALPRLHYVSDGGSEPNRYFQRVLRKLTEPGRPGRLLRWTRVIDFYHACAYITKLSEAFSGQVVGVTSWARKMRHCLRDKRNGAFRVLHAAAALRARSRRRWTRAQSEGYREGYGYLRKRKRFMDYAAYRRQGLPIGSGVTEAACKTVFTQRLKQSGMTWEVEGGQVILDLRTMWLSGVWSEVHGAYLAAKPLSQAGTRPAKRPKNLQIAA
jgi:hypothetical protein